MHRDSRLSSLEAKHKSLEQSISDEFTRPNPDSVRIAKLKREKLRLKEKIFRYQNSLPAQ